MYWLIVIQGSFYKHEAQQNSLFQIQNNARKLFTHIWHAQNKSNHCKEYFSHFLCPSSAGSLFYKEIVVSKVQSFGHMTTEITTWGVAERSKKSGVWLL